MKLSLVLIVSAAATLCLGAEYKSFPPDFVAKLDSVAAALMKCYKVPAISLAAVDFQDRDNLKMLSKAYGVKSVVTKEKATAKSKFAIGSISKSFTAAAFGNYVNLHPNVSYNTPVSSLMPAGTRFSLDAQLQKYADMRDILSHRTGLSSADGTFFVGTTLSRDDLVKNVELLPTEARLRESFVYNNDMFALAGALVERINGTRLEKLMEELIFEPYQMDAKYMSLMSDNASDVALPHYGVGDGTNKSYTMRVTPFGPFKKMVGTEGYYNGAGGIMASADDMLQYLIFWQQLGGYPKILGKAALHELDKPQAALMGFLTKPPRFSYMDANNFYTANAFLYGTHRGYVRFEHGGQLGPYISKMTFMGGTEPHVGIFVSTSGPGAIIGAVAALGIEQSFLELVFNKGEFKEWGPDKVCFKLDIARLTPHPTPLNTIPLVKPNRYEGTYEHPLVGRATIKRVSAAHLQVNIGTVGSARIALRSHASDLEFQLRFRDFLWFLEDAIAWGVGFGDRSKSVEFVRGHEEDGRMSGVRFGWMLFKHGATAPMPEQLLFKRVQSEEKEGVWGKLKKAALKKSFQ